MVVTAALPPPTGPPLSVDEPPPPVAPAWDGARLAVGGGLWVGAFVGSLLSRGIPLEREQVLAWAIAAMVVLAWAMPGRRVRQVLLDWLPIVLVLAAYDYSRGAADQMGMPVHVTPQLEADRLLFGGTVPTVWLQDRLLDPDRVHPWEVVPAVVYLSHFVVPFALAAVLWVRDRRRWVAYVWRFVVLSFLGVATFVLFPAAPPWLAARDGGPLAGQVGRVTGRGWSVVDLDIAGRLLSKGQASVNLTAAIPSLHAAYALLVAVTLWPSVGRAARALLAAYAVAMGASLVLLGEHYVVDVLVGWGYVALAVWLADRLRRRWRRWRRSSAPGAQLEYSKSQSDDRSLTKSV